MGVGKLYNFNDEFIVNVSYQFHNESKANWWGELVPTEYRQLCDGDGYVIELLDGRRGSCFLKRRINRAVNGVPPLYYYHFKGRGPLK